ncbi:MAG TPA: hypothetical protein VG820_00185 [Fimbriimonadaceae bacterium]|nr:hypothetical protein [Fimbriimonadaceae bacterium]
MLLPLLLLIQKPAADGIQRFQDFIQRNKSFSVQIKAKSGNIPFAGKGTYVVRQPDSFKLAIDWGGATDYSYVKNETGSVEFERYRKTYQEYRSAPGLDYDESVFAASQMDSLPLPLIAGDLHRFVPRGTAYKLSSKAKESETYIATWQTQDNSGKVVATLGTDGRLLHFDLFAKSPLGQLHRIADYSNYVLNPKLPADAFSTIPPLGFTAYQLPYYDPVINVGEPLKLGSWQSASGPADVDEAVRGKLAVVREPDSPPADALIEYLGKQKLPVETVVLSIGSSGGQFWSPSKPVAQTLGLQGTPLVLLVGDDGKTKAMWMGFDPDNPEKMIGEIAEAVKGKSK